MRIFGMATHPDQLNNHSNFRINQSNLIIHTLNKLKKNIHSSMINKFVLNICPSNLIKMSSNTIKIKSLL